MPGGNSGTRFDMKQTGEAWIRWSGAHSPESVQLVDYSISGIRMHYAGYADIGQTIWLYSSSAKNLKPLLEGRIQWVQRSNSGNALGCYLFNEKGREIPVHSINHPFCMWSQQKSLHQPIWTICCPVLFKMLTKLRSSETLVKVQN